MMKRLSTITAALFFVACGGDDLTNGDGGATGGGAHTLFVSEGETLVAFDVGTGAARSATIAQVKGATDLQATDDGYLVTNLSGADEILIVDARTFREVKRVKSSSMGGKRPVHGYLSPTFEGRRSWLAHNDGDGMPGTNSLLFIDLTAGATFGTALGEIPLGLGHHKAALSRTRARVSVSNIGDCANLVQVIDYADPRMPKLVRSWSADDIDSSRPCNAMMGAGPHGAASAGEGRGYHNLTGWGAILSVSQDQELPTVGLRSTRGNGAGYTKASKDGKYVYSLQRTPRQGDTAKPGVDCQIGQLLIIDAATDGVTDMPLKYTGGDCAAKLPAHAQLAAPDHLRFSNDGLTMFVTTQATAPTGSTDPAYADQVLVLDLTNPAQPVQRASISVGKHSGHRGMTVSGDGRWLFVVNNTDKTVSQIDVAMRTVLRTIKLKETPGQVATWGAAEGPSSQSGPL